MHRLIFIERKIFMILWKFECFEKLTTDSENRHKTCFTTTRDALKGQAYTAMSFTNNLGRYSMQESYPSCIFPVSVRKFKISIK